MKAAVFYGPHDLRVEEVKRPQLRGGDILIRVKACGICGSDLHPYKVGSAPGFQVSGIMGHEFSGEVAELGTGVEGLAVGDRVAAAGYEPCGTCYWCRQGKSFRCSRMALVGYQLDGAFAEYVRIPRAQVGMTVFPLPENLDWEVAATIEPVSVSSHMVRRSEVRPEDTAVVLGAGMIGQGIVQVLKAQGVSRVMVSELAPKRLALARRLGADEAIDAREVDPLKAVAELSAGNMADVVFECTGSPLAFRQALDTVRGGGMVMQVGLHEHPVELDLNILIQRNITVRGCLGGSFPRAIALLQSGKVKTKELITHRFPLEEAKTAFDTQLNADEAVKVLIKP